MKMNCVVSDPPSQLHSGGPIGIRNASRRRVVKSLLLRRPCGSIRIRTHNGAPRWRRRPQCAAVVASRRFVVDPEAERFELIPYGSVARAREVQQFGDASLPGTVRGDPLRGGRNRVGVAAIDSRCAGRRDGRIASVVVHWNLSITS